MRWRLGGRTPEPTSTRSVGTYGKLAVKHFHQGGEYRGLGTVRKQSMKPWSPRNLGWWA